MTIALGIDTGGTYTDAVLVNHETGQVITGAKALTTRRDLSIGIEKAVSNVFAHNHLSLTPADVGIVALSTTLATNAIVEGQGSPVCLLLIGYDADLIKQHGFERDLVTNNVVYVAGGHNGLGNEVMPLDEAAVRQAVLAYRDHVEAFAVSGFFSVRNPAHELRVKALVEELTSGKPVTCGHELTTRLNAVRRATTVALNASLIPLLQELLTTVRHSLQKIGIEAPLMVVKGDGSLVRAEWAMQRPIETILSGPAASVVGAWHLSGQGEVWVVDMGGTTTDIAALAEGRPRINPEGAQVGRWRTMVEAVDVHTVGLGGDSRVQVNRPYEPATDWLTIGPRRIVPLYLLAEQHPEVIEELAAQAADPRPDQYAGQFVLANRRPTHKVPAEDLELLGLLASGPRSFNRLAAEGERHRFILARQLERLTNQRLALLAGFTPTDALYAQGYFADSPAAEASRLGAGLLAVQAGLPAADFCRKVIEGVSGRVATELVSASLAGQTTLPRWDKEPTARTLLNLALTETESRGLTCRLILDQPVVAIGAPVQAYFPRVTHLLHTNLVIPPHAEVANAVGAVAGGVVQEAKVIIHPKDGLESAYRVHLPDGVHDFRRLDEGVAYARQHMLARLELLARQAGADQVEISMTRVDHLAPIRPEWGGEIYLGTELTFTAMGRPAIAL